MKQGDVYWYEFRAPDKRRPVLILTRNERNGSSNNYHNSRSPVGSRTYSGRRRHV